MPRWFYRDERYKYGPLTWDQMLAAVKACRLKPQHVVSQDEVQWVKAETVAELFAAQADDQPQQPAPATSPPAPSKTPPAAATKKPGEYAPTMEWEIGSSTDATREELKTPQIDRTMEWDIVSGDSRSDASRSGGSSPGETRAGGSSMGQPGSAAGSSDAFDIFEEPGSSTGSSGSARAGATMVVRGLSPGAVLGNYQILETLGEGGMGTVLKARHVRMDRMVALKILRTQSTKPAGAVKRFQQEVKAASRLTHPNIVTAHDADEVRGVHFLVMEYVEGHDLDELLAEREKLPYQEAVAYVLQVATGLAYAHGEGVIHRDIKPGNLMIDKRNAVKILDMGLASIKQTATDQAQREESAHVTQADQILGTFDYMPPEQAADARSADHRADIYSLGCTLFKLITGKPPYHGTTTMNKILAHREHPIPMISKSCPEAPFDLDAVFGKMVAKEPEMRYQSMDEVVADLEACLQSKPISAWQTGSWGNASSGGSAVNLSDEKLRIEPPTEANDDDLDEYLLSPLDEGKKEKPQPKQKQDTAEVQKQETKEITPRWYWRVMGEEIGPLTLEDLKEQNINTWDEVRREDSEQWIIAQDVKELFD